MRVLFIVLFAATLVGGVVWIIDHGVVGGQPPATPIIVVPPQPTQQTAAPPQGGGNAAQPLCSSVNPSSAIGGTWSYFGGNQWRFNGSTTTVRGAHGWTVHTPLHPYDPGLPVGEAEATTVATAYNMNNCKTQ